MIGIYGGTFDPIHNGHLRTALDVQQALKLEHVRLLPCSQPPHRTQPGVTAAMRLQMLRLAVGLYSDLQIDDRELSRAGPSYMVDTLQSIRAEIGEQPLILIIGADAFKHLSGWNQWQRLFDFAHVLVMSRPGSAHQIDSEIQFLQPKLVEDPQYLRAVAHGYLFFQEVTQLDISATRIRQIFKAGLSPRFLLPDAVIEFIKQNQLYSADSVDIISDQLDIIER